MRPLLYVTKKCPYCKNAILWFEQRSIPVNVIVIETIEEKINLYKKLSSETGKSIRNVPQIFIPHGDNMVHIGGYSDLIKSQYARSYS